MSTKKQQDPTPPAEPIDGDVPLVEHIGATEEYASELAEMRADLEKPVLPRVTDTATMLEWLRIKAAGQSDDAAEVYEQIAAEIFAAESAAAVLGGSDPKGARDVLGMPIIVESVTFREGEMEDGLKYYAVFRGKFRNSGRPVAVTCGGLKVVMQAMQLEILNALPVTVAFFELDRVTKRGFKPLRMEAVDF